MSRIVAGANLHIMRGQKKRRRRSNKSEHEKKCIWCEGSGYTFDIDYNAIDCLECKGTGIAREESA